ncbi:MAG: hypothetical protein ACI81P_002010 [Neolewinella sp.]|jgi:uncharacterized protein (DUF1015 family)
MQKIFKRSENKSVRSKTSKLFIRRPLGSFFYLASIRYLMSLNLHPFPRFYTPPLGNTPKLPLTRNGVHKLPEKALETKPISSFAELIIRTNSNGARSRGICGLLPAICFLDGTVRPHEKTLLKRLQRQEKLVLEDKGALGKPVLLTVPSLKDWWAQSDILHDYLGQPFNFKGNDNAYEVRRYTSNVLDLTGDTLPTLPLKLPASGPLCIADGHHRAETHARLGAAGVPGFEYVPVCVIGADELTIGAFARLIDDDRPMEEMLPSLTPFFEVELLNTPLAPSRPGEWLLLRNGSYYQLRRKGPSAPVDVEWLEHTVLPAVFDITDTRSDQRITFEPVENTAEGLVDFTPSSKYTCLVGFPLPTSTFFAEIEAGRILPPKSTRFEPRVPSGLVVWKP